MRTYAWQMVLGGLVATGAMALSIGACSPAVMGSGPGGGGAASTSGTTTSPGGEWCGGVQCPGGQICCFTSGACFDASEPSACPTAEGAYVTSDAGLPPNLGSPCNSDDDCVAGWFCASDSGCLGPGQCEQPEGDDCGSSTGITICACDGNDYPRVEALCPLRLRTAGEGKCGRQPAGGPPNHVVCVFDSQCPMGFDCCETTSRCYDPTKPANCATPPRHTSFSCTDDADCPDSFCYAPTCGGPKGCYDDVHPECTSLDAPVCGCDDKTYLNEGCALAHHVAVAHDFKCK